jgi:hypothetical protein
VGFELLDPAIHRQKDFNDGLASGVIDRLGFSAVHTLVFDGAELCPPKGLNAYPKQPICRHF